MRKATKATVERQKPGARQRTTAAKTQAKTPTVRRKKNVRAPKAVAEDVRQLLVTEAMPFAFNGQEVRVVDHDGQPWFASADVCGLLEIRNSRQAVARLDDDEKGVTTSDTNGGPQALGVVNESGLYRLIFKSRKPQAKVFRRWVTSEVLPSIRKTGSYKVAAEAAPPEEVRPLQVKLPGPGRYVITVFSDQPAYVRRTEYDAILNEYSVLDSHLMACALRTTAAYWHKVQLLRAVGADQAEGDMVLKLERAILDGSVLGRNCLHALLLEQGGQ